MTTSRPARALRGAAVVLLGIVVARLPAIEQRFTAAMTATIPRDAERQRGSPAPRLLAKSDAPLLIASTLMVPASTRSDVRTARPRPSSASGDRRAAPPSDTRTVVAAVPPSAPLAAAPLELATTGSALPVISPQVAPRGGDPSRLATDAYLRLAAGDRRNAVRLFDAALANAAQSGGDPRLLAWQRQRDTLSRRWSASAYSIIRGSGPVGFGAEPVLGGGQSGAGVAFTPDPLSQRPVAVTLRGSVAHDDAGRSGFVAAGVQWHPIAGVTLAAERLVAAGPAGPNDWTVRLAAGTDRARGRWRLTAYGEGGIIGHATYAALQGRIAAIVHDAGVELDPGVGVWSSLQRDRGTTVDRVDLGPGVALRAGPLAVEIDYRVRVAGNAAPGSGPVATLSAAF